MPLTPPEKDELYQKFQIPLTNQIRHIERLAVQGASHREIEVSIRCLHTTANDARKKLGMPFNEDDVDPSVYGENGDPGK